MMEKIHQISKTLSSKPSSDPYDDMDFDGNDYDFGDEGMGGGYQPPAPKNGSDRNNQPSGAISQDGEIDGDLASWMEEQGAKSGEDPSKDEQDPLPYRLEGGIRHYDAKDGDRDPNYDFEIEVKGEDASSLVETQGSVTLNLPKDAEAKISKSGDFLVVKFKKETLKIDLKKASSVHFVGGKVSGDIDNEDKKITTDQGAFIPNKDIEHLKDIMGGLAGKIGAVHVPPAPDGELHVSVAGVPEPTKDPGTKYIFGRKEATLEEIYSGEKQVEQVKKIFSAMNKAFSETDPKKQAELWENATDLLKDYVTQDKDGGAGNNVGHMIAGILMEELGGKQEMLKVFARGQIPASFASAIVTALKANPSETTDLADVEPWYRGGELGKKTHGTLANAFEQAASGKTGGKDNE